MAFTRHPAVWSRLAELERDRPRVQRAGARPDVLGAVELNLRFQHQAVAKLLGEAKDALQRPGVLVGGEG